MAPRSAFLAGLVAGGLLVSCGFFPQGPSGLARGTTGPFQPDPPARPSTPSPGPAAQGVDTSLETARLQSDLNRLRQSQGLSEWSFPAGLQQIALARALELASRGGLTHMRTAEATPAVLAMLEADGFSGRLAEHLLRVTDPGEELASTVIRAWFGDPAHRADLLSPDYQASGVGIASADGGWVVVQVLAEFVPPSEVPQ